MRRGFELTPVNVRALVRLAASTDRTAASARTAQTLALSTRSAGTGPHRHQVNDLASACPSHGARPCTPHAQRERNPTPPPYRRAHTRPQARPGQAQAQAQTRAKARAWPWAWAWHRATPAPGQRSGFGLSFAWCKAMHTPCAARKESRPAPLSAGTHTGAHGPHGLLLTDQAPLAWM